MTAQLQSGDYVLATKYSDGDPMDHWAIGFYCGPTPHHPDRFEIRDEHGELFRANGFRRAEKISGERGRWLLKHAVDIERSGMSLWHFATCEMT